MELPPQSKTTCRSLNIIGKALVFTLLCLCLKSVQVDRKVYAGQVNFFPAGEVASPCYFHEVGLSVSLSTFLTLDKRVNSTINYHLDRIVANLKEANYSSPEKVVERVRQKVKPALDDLRQGVADLKQVMDFTKTERSAFLLGALVGTVAAVGSAIYSASEVHEMGRKLEKEQKRVVTLSHDLRSLRHVFSYERIRDEEFFQKEEAVMEINTQILLASKKVQSVLVAYYELHEHRLHPALATPTVLEKIKKKVEHETSTTGAQPVLNINKEVFRVPISYLLGPHSLLMVLHIPFVADGRYHLRKLYEVGTAVLTGTGRLVKFTPEVPFISVDQRSEMHQLMTAADLERCTKIGSVRLCPDMSILQKQVSSCIAALYYRQTLKASLLCSTSTLEFNKNIFQVNRTAYAIRKGVEVQLQCPKQDPQFFAIKENKVQIVPRGCKLMGPDFVVIKTMSK